MGGFWTIHTGATPITTPPPAYDGADANGNHGMDAIPDGEYVATTQTTTITTTTTTHFFPRLRRKILPMSQAPSGDAGSEQLITYPTPAERLSIEPNTVRRPSSARVDKDLPQLPTGEARFDDNSSQPQSQLPLALTVEPSALPSSSTTTQSPSSIHSPRPYPSPPQIKNKKSNVAAALAHASLGLGPAPLGVSLGDISHSHPSIPSATRPSSSFLTFFDPPPLSKAPRHSESLDPIARSSEATLPGSSYSTPNIPSLANPTRTASPASAHPSPLRRLKSFSSRSNRLASSSSSASQNNPPVLTVANTASEHPPNQRRPSTAGPSATPTADSREVRRKRGMSIGATIFSRASVSRFSEESPHPSQPLSAVELPSTLPVPNEHTRFRVKSDAHIERSRSYHNPQADRGVEEFPRSPLSRVDPPTQAQPPPKIPRRNSLWFSNKRKDAEPAAPMPVNNVPRYSAEDRPNGGSSRKSRPSLFQAEGTSRDSIDFGNQQPMVSPFGMQTFIENAYSSPSRTSFDQSPPLVNSPDEGILETPNGPWEVPPIIASPIAASPITLQFQQGALSSNNSLLGSSTIPEEKIEDRPGANLQSRRSFSRPSLSAALGSARRRSMSLLHSTPNITPSSSRPSTPKSGSAMAPPPSTERTYLFHEPLPENAQYTPPASVQTQPSPLFLAPTSTSSRSIPLLRKLSQTFLSPSASAASSAMPSPSASTLADPSERGASFPLSSNYSGGSRTPPSSLGRSSGGDRVVAIANPDTDTKPSTVPLPWGEETPELYLGRLTEAVSKAEVAGILASSNDEFHTRALQAYMSRFRFHSDPLDVALRKLLMDVGLPRETQQIDRVMEAFASRYEDCNPGLFMSPDHPYVIAFSLIMLHTDAFNKSNKNKMSKADYIKNTRLPGVLPEVLDCFFDNITFAPFIFIEDPMDVNGQRGYVPDGSTSVPSGVPFAHPVGAGGGSLSITRTRIDPYYIISQGLLDPLRADVESFVPIHNPYSYTGVEGILSEGELHQAFACAPEIEITQPVRRKSMPLLGGGGLSDSRSSGGKRSLQITKIGILARKEDLLDGGRKASNRKWKDWSVILTGSQLLFFKDTSLALTLMDASHGDAERLFMLKPDELISLKDAIVLYDDAYDRHSNTARLIMPGGRQYLIRASTAQDLAQWLSLINYASAFKSSGVRMRAMGMTGRQAASAGTAAALSHVKDLARSTSFSLQRTPVPDAETETLDTMSMSIADDLSPPAVDVSGLPLARMTVRSVVGGVDLDHVMASQGDARLEDTFNEVKAELAAHGHGPVTAVRSQPRAISLGLTLLDPASSSSASPLVTNDPSHTPPSLIEDGDSGSSRLERQDHRANVIRSKLEDLDDRILTTRVALDSDLRVTRNLRLLTPFQRSTRDRVQAAVVPVAKRVKQLRIDLMRLQCQKDVLAADLSADEADWRRTKEVALKAATKELKVRGAIPLDHGFASLQTPVEAEASRLRPSSHMDSMVGVSPSATFLSVGTDHQDSSAASFVTAVDDPNTENPRSSPQTTASFFTATPSLSHSNLRPDTDDGDDALVMTASSSLLQPPRRTRSASFSFSSSSSNLASHPLTPSTSDTHQAGDVVPMTEFSDLTAAADSPSAEIEVAEEWSKTRAAKRVSLVTMPNAALLAAPAHIRRARIRSEGSGSFALLESDEAGFHRLPALSTERRVVSDVFPGR